MAGCSDKGGQYDPDDKELSLEQIRVSRISRAGSLEGQTNLPPGDVSPLTDENMFSENSLLYISQLGTTTAPNFTEGATSNLYIYKYKANPAATWEQDYNFVVNDGSSPLTWVDVKNMGSVGNAFSLYAMTFPGNQISFSVNQDQTGGTGDQYNQQNFFNSDILGAYHATSALYTRLRFNLFHLMVYLKVTIYVPVYQDQTNDANQFSYSGFKEGAVQEAYVLNAYRNFTIDWTANRSSDTEAPLTYGTGNSGSIKMYMHQPDSTPFELENVTDYFGDSKLETDRVRAYNFSVLFPARNSTDKTNISLYFLLQNVDVDDTEKYYFFESNQIATGTYSPAQGTLQQLYLYLPRTDNKAILVGAKILPWGSSFTDMTVTEQTASQEENPDNGESN